MLLFCICCVSAGSFFVSWFQVLCYGSFATSGVFCRNHEHKQWVCMRVRNHSSTRRWQLLDYYYYDSMLLYNKTSPKLKTTWWISASRPKHAPKESINSLCSNRQVAQKRKMKKVYENENQQNDKSKYVVYARIHVHGEIERYDFIQLCWRRNNCIFGAKFCQLFVLKRCHLCIGIQAIEMCVAILVLCCFVYSVPRYACMCFHFFIRLK